MLNTEIGTYQIAEAIRQKPFLSAKIEGRCIKSIINGVEFVGNWNILQKVVDCFGVMDGFDNNEIIVNKKPTEILDEVYGISIEKDWEAVYDKDETWRLAKLNATEEDKKRKQSKFKLTTYDDRGLL